MTLVRALHARSLIVPVSQTGCVLGDIVCSAGSNLVTKANPLIYQSMPAIGILISISGSSALMATTGQLVGVYNNLVPNSVYYVGLEGVPGLISELTNKGRLFLQQLGVAVSTDLLMLNIGVNIVRYGQ